MSLSYDDSVPYEELPAVPLKERIGTTKVYLREDCERRGKRKFLEGSDSRPSSPSGGDAFDGDVSMDADTDTRPNALYLHGAPISHLPTTRIFEYASQYDVHPYHLEWLDDFSCVIVFETNDAARLAFDSLKRPGSEGQQEEGEAIHAHPLPATLWPAADRIASTLKPEQSEDAEDVHKIMKGPITLRFARSTDVKQRNAKAQSQYYKKNGRPVENNFQSHSSSNKRRRTEHGPGAGHEDNERAREIYRAKLDEELDLFLAQGDGDDELPTEASDGQDTPPSAREEYSDRPRLKDRITAPLPRRAQRRRNQPTTNGTKVDLFDDDSGPVGKGMRAWSDDEDQTTRAGVGIEGDWNVARMNTMKRIRTEAGRGPGKRRTGGHQRRPDSRFSTAEQLDEELDAFLREG